MTTTQDVMGVTGNRMAHYSAAVFFLILYLAQLVLIFQSGPLTAWSLPLVALAIYCADVLSGMAHFYLDYRRTTPQSGLRELYYYEGNKGSDDYVQKRKAVMTNISPLEQIVFDFKVHHLSPGALARRSFLRLALPAMYFIGIPVVAIMLVLSSASWLNPYTGLFLWVVTGALILAQYAHSCAHKRQVPVIPLLLQKTSLFMTAEQHRSHHADLGVDFCILNGWGNSVVNRLFRLCRRRGWVFEDGLTPI